jgi:hypothetical protein
MLLRNRRSRVPTRFWVKESENKKSALDTAHHLGIFGRLFSGVIGWSILEMGWGQRKAFVSLE